MLTEHQYQEMMIEATVRNARMDKADRAAGFATPAEAGDRLLLATIASGIESGMRAQDWQTVAEAQAMLLQMIRAKTPRRTDGA